MRRFCLLAAFSLLVLLSWGPSLSDGRPNGYQVVHNWPQLPDGYFLGQVAGVGVDAQNRVFIFHRGVKPVLCFDGDSGKILASWGDGLFDKGAHGLAVDAEGNVWITDIVLHQVFKFSPKGELLMTLGAKGVSGLDANHFNKPTDVAVAPNGDFYVTDGYGNSRVAKFASDGKFLFDWGQKGDGPGEFNTPHGVTVDPQGRVYVADRENIRMQVFDADGKFLRQWKSEELGRPWGVEMGPDGFLYVADGGDFYETPPARNRVLRLDLEGKILDKWGSFGQYDGQFYWAHDVAVGQDGAVYVVDVSLGMRVQKFVRR